MLRYQQLWKICPTRLTIPASDSCKFMKIEAVGNFISHSEESYFSPHYFEDCNSRGNFISSAGNLHTCISYIKGIT